MGYAWDGKLIVDPARSEIHGHIITLRRNFQSLSLQEIGRRVATIRQLGIRHGFDPVSALASSLADAVARHGRGAMIGPYLAALGEAAICDSAEAGASETFLATISVRLAG